MSILGRFAARRGSGALEGRTLTSSAFVPPPSTGVLDDYVGIHRAMANLTVMACVRLLADTIASLPWKAYRRDKNGIPVELNPQPAVLKTPFPGFDLFQYKWMMVASLALRGNFYGLVTNRDSSLKPTAILPLHPDIVFLERRPDLLLWFDPIYRIMGEQVPSEDLLHIRRFTMAGEPYGLSPVRQASIAIGMALAAEEYGYRWFKESATPSGLLTTEQDLDEAAVTRQQKNWIASHGGRRMPAVLTGGFKWEQLSVSPNESQFLETRKFQRSEIAMMYGIPPHMIGDVEKSTSWGTGIEQQNIGAIVYTFRSWSAPIESIMSALLPAGQYVRFDYKALLRGDLKARYEAYDKALHSGWINVNEIRAWEEMEPIGPTGDIYLQPVNYAPLGFVPVSNQTQPTQPSAPKDKTPENPGPKGVPPIAGGEHNDPVAASLRYGAGYDDGIADHLTRMYGLNLIPQNGRPVEVGS